MEQPLVAKHIGGTIRDRNDPSRTRRTDEVPFIAGCSHFTRKNKVSCSGFLPKTSPCNIHAAIQCDLQPQLQNRIELRTQEQPPAKHMNFATETTPAAPAAQIEVPFIAGCKRKTQGFVLRLPPQNIAHATFMQPFQRDLQPQLQEPHRTTHTGTRSKHIGSSIRDRNDPSRTRHRRGTFQAASHFTRKNPRFRAPASSAHAPCSHSNICNHSFKNRIELRTQEQPLVAKHQFATTTPAAPAATRYHRRLQPL